MPEWLRLLLELCGGAILAAMAIRKGKGVVLLSYESLEAVKGELRALRAEIEGLPCLRRSCPVVEETEDQ